MSELMGEKQQEMLFKRLLSRNENSTCADCKSKGAAWASLDFGVFVCIQCSGVHRSFGMHVTRIRSTKLDSWIVSDYKVFETVGNVTANLYWEHAFKNKSIASVSSDEERSTYIKAKYRAKQYAFPGKTDPVTLYLDSGCTLKPEEIKAEYETETEPHPKITSIPTKQPNFNTTQNLKSNSHKKDDENLLDFHCFEQTKKLASQKNYPDCNNDLFSFDFIGQKQQQIPANPKTQPQELSKPQTGKVHHDFGTSDLLFDFTKPTNAYSSPPSTNQLNNGNVYNINNLNVFHQNFNTPAHTQPQPQFNSNEQASAHGHLDRYAVFDTFKLNYQNYGYHN